MLLVNTKVEASKINGIGLFAHQFIPKGTTQYGNFTLDLTSKLIKMNLLNYQK